ncbi:hypothetical protein [Nostoc sp. UHCC 0252]|uniref:hypothetical protein n=1 Tax=Nostoc sp. UHCC 0252 TaxID=3110241 RepID=UPI002B1E9915|nr:hypothetical protein [Nostoc sp. UHCC 0252]MEA5606307.1 hypothetical protein [Nostoc sp. UHCC 0252]
MRGGIQRGTLPTLASLSSERSEVCRRQKARLASSPNTGVGEFSALRMYGGKARGWGREYKGVAVLLIILQLTGEDSNGVAGI